MGKKLKIRENHALELYDELAKLRWQIGQLDFGNRAGMPTRSIAQAELDRETRLAEWDRTALGRLLKTLKRHLN